MEMRVDVRLLKAGLEELQSLISFPVISMKMLEMLIPGNVDSHRLRGKWLMAVREDFISVSRQTMRREEKEWLVMRAKLVKKAQMARRRQ